MDEIYKDILEKIADIREFPDGAYNIRVDGKSIGRENTRTVEIKAKEASRGIDVFISSDAFDETIHIPVVIGITGHSEVVYNDFYIDKGARVTIVAGCGIHNCGSGRSQHDGIHSFHVGAGAHVIYSEKHIGSGDGTGERILNPVTNIHLSENSYLEMETTQIEGVDSTERETIAEIGDGATLIVREKLMTHGKQYAKTVFVVNLNGYKSGADIVSRSVAKDDSEQIFLSVINGNNVSTGHSECDAIIMDNAVVKAVPEITANNVDASLIHEAAIGRIAGEQIVKLMTLGLDEQQAEQKIIEGFLN